MSTFTEQEIRNRASRERTRVNKQARSILDTLLTEQLKTDKFDIFLSHAFTDADLVLGVKKMLEDFGHSVYVDWVADPHLDRTQVSAATAGNLRERIQGCASLLYAGTPNAAISKWMPWECGYADGRGRQVATLPVTTSGEELPIGQEYLGLYPYVAVSKRSDGSPQHLWVQWDPSHFVSFSKWLTGATITGAGT